MATADTVNGRIERAQTKLAPAQMAAGFLFIVALGFTLPFVQDPLIHDSLHNFRHMAGIACH